MKPISCQDLLNLCLTNTPFATTIFFVVAFVFVFTLLFGPSREVALSMLGLGLTTVVIEFRRPLSEGQNENEISRTRRRSERTGAADLIHRIVAGRSNAHPRDIEA